MCILCKTQNVKSENKKVIHLASTVFSLDKYSHDTTEENKQERQKRRVRDVAEAFESHIKMHIQYSYILDSMCK